MKYQGSCHCGNVAFEVQGDLDGVEPDGVPADHFEGRSS